MKISVASKRVLFVVHLSCIVRGKTCAKGGDIGGEAFVSVGRVHQRADDLGPVGHFHFFEDVVEMGLYGPFADM